MQKYGKQQQKSGIESTWKNLIGAPNCWIVFNKSEKTLLEYGRNQNKIKN